MRLLSVSGAADRLGISSRRVRQLLATGQLHGEQLGREWAVDSEAVEQLRSHRGPIGRRWSAASAWAVLAVADGNDDRLAPVARSRARRRLAEHGLAGLVDRLRARAELCRLYGHPAAHDRLLAEPGVVRGGVSAAGRYDLELIAADAVEVYVLRGRCGELVDRYALDVDAERPNVLIRIVDDSVWPFPADADVAPLAVVAVDLMDADDERSRRAGRDLAARWSWRGRS